MAVPYLVRSNIQQASTTATTGGTVFLTSAAPTGRFNYRDLFANGDKVALYLSDSTSGHFEASWGTFATGGSGPTSDSITTRTITHSYLGTGVPVPWGAGTRNVYCLMSAQEVTKNSDNLAGLASASASRTNLGLGDIAIEPSSRFGIVKSGWSGGTTGKVVRWASADTFADAANTDTVAQLGLIAYKASDGYVRRSLITGLSGLTAGVTYYLGTSGNWTTTAPTVTAGGSTKLVIVGYAASTTSMDFAPRLIAHG